MTPKISKIQVLTGKRFFYKKCPKSRKVHLFYFVKFIYLKNYYLLR